MSGPLLAVIPARCKSKRIPGKNIKCLGGQPLIAYTITAAIESRLFERIVVTTDCPEAAAVSRQYGAETPFLRDESLSDDFTPVSAATADVLTRLAPKARPYSAVAQLMPTCPLRTAGDIISSYTQFTASAAESQISVMRYGSQNPWWAMHFGHKGELEPLFADRMAARSQDLPELFCPTGAIWWAHAASLLRAKTFYLRGYTGWEIPWPRGIDIDSHDDWELARLSLQPQEGKRTVLRSDFQVAVPD